MSDKMRGKQTTISNKIKTKNNLHNLHVCAGELF